MKNRKRIFAADKGVAAAAATPYPKMNKLV